MISLSSCPWWQPDTATKPAEEHRSYTTSRDTIYSHKNTLSVSGEDPGWVDATFLELERILDAVRPQSRLLRRFRWVAIIILATAIGWSWNQLSGQVLSVFFSDEATTPPPKWAVYLMEHQPLRYSLSLMLTTFTGFFPSLSLIAWLKKLWPPIEFDFGPEHLKRRKRLRGRLSIVITILLLPFAIEVFKRYALGWQ
jgi:hypothetical protein